MRRAPEPRFGRTRLPDEQRAAIRTATRLEWATIASLAVTATLMFLVLGNSQAMRAAWIEDLLSVLPPLAFLVASRVARLEPTEEHPYGFHRATAIAHLVAALALLALGGVLVVEAVATLVALEHPTIGGVSLFGGTVWLGWLMIGVLALTIPAPVLLGRAKARCAETLHDKVLYADADMNRADWRTAGAAILGVLGIGVGLWWADAAAALLIAVSVTRDGARNLVGAVQDLGDRRARSVDDVRPHPLGARIDETLRGLDWVADARSRIRDEGHVFHVESFVVPTSGRTPGFAQLRAAREACVALDWKVQDLVVVPVDELPAEFLPGTRGGPGGED